MITIKLKKLFLYSIILCIIFSCEKKENKSDTDIAGTWKGSFNSSLIGNSDLMLIVQQDGSAISGNYYSNISVGTISGSVSGSKLTFTLTQTSSYCTGIFSGNGTISGESITFSFNGTDCLGTHLNGTGLVKKESVSTVLPQYSIIDLVGKWKGTASNATNSFPVTVTVTSTGNVSGSGVSSQWTINSMGTVNGEGSFMFISGTHLYDASAAWHLQLNESKNTLSGIFNVYIAGLNNLKIALVKQ